MEASFVLELDTTGPVIEAFGPSYATIAYPETIIIEANENLADYQDIYFIDAAGVRHDMIFSYQVNKFVGIVYFSLFSIGIATMYARAMDEVYNLSNTAIYNVNVIQSAKLEIITSDSSREIENAEEQRMILTDEEIRMIGIDDYSRIISSSENIRYIEVGEE